MKDIILKNSLTEIKVDRRKFNHGYPGKAGRKNEDKVTATFTINRTVKEEAGLFLKGKQSVLIELCLKKHIQKAKAEIEVKEIPAKKIAKIPKKAK